MTPKIAVGVAVSSLVIVLALVAGIVLSSTTSGDYCETQPESTEVDWAWANRCLDPAGLRAYLDDLERAP